MDKLRQQLLALAPKLPRAVGDQQASSPLNPPLVAIKDDPSSNAEVIAFDYLSNPAAKLDSICSSITI